MRHLLRGRLRPMVAREASTGGGDRSIGRLDRGSRKESRDPETEPKERASSFPGGGRKRRRRRQYNEGERTRNKEDRGSSPLTDLGK
ncbi:hypothetical protein BHM03_00028298 [Ensete ventricosum]|nr:hypothetical protein BHM03_00028298 [Ensete ventricosum]